MRRLPRGRGNCGYFVARVLKSPSRDVLLEAREPKVRRDGGEVGRVAAKEASAGKDEHDVETLRRVHNRPPSGMTPCCGDASGMVLAMGSLNNVEAEM